MKCNKKENQIKMPVNYGGHGATSGQQNKKNNNKQNKNKNKMLLCIVKPRQMMESTVNG